MMRNVVTGLARVIVPIQILILSAASPATAISADLVLTENINFWSFANFSLCKPLYKPGALARTFTIDSTRSSDPSSVEAGAANGLPTQA